MKPGDRVTALAQVRALHSRIRHARTGRALLHVTHCGNRVDVRAYSVRQYRVALDMLNEAWSVTRVTDRDKQGS